MAGAQHRCGMQAGDFDFTTLDMGCLSEHPAPECVHRERSGAGGSRGPRRAATPSSRLCEPPPAPRSGAIPRPPSRPSPPPRLLGPPPSFLSLPPQSLLLARPVRARDCLPRSSLESRGLWVSHRSVCAHLCASPSLYQSLSAYLCLSVCLFLGLIAVSVRQSISPSGPGVAAGRARVAMSGACTSYVSAEQEVVRGFSCPRPGGEAAAVFCCGFRDHKYCCDDPHSFFPYEHSYMWWLRYRPWPSPHLVPRARPSHLAPSSAQPRAKPSVLIQVRTPKSTPTPTPPLPAQALTSPDPPCSRFSAPFPHFNSTVIQIHP